MMHASVMKFRLHSLISMVTADDTSCQLVSLFESMNI